MVHLVSNQGAHSGGLKLKAGVYLTDEGVSCGDLQEETG
jgi:hypothetical protein